MAGGEHLWILVHGTFARAAPWTRTESALSAAIAAAPANRLSVFDWSGRNSGLARWRAAGALADLIRSVQDDYDSVSLIGHSHGGNVIRLALEGEGVRPARDCVFLGTPFILAGRRDTGRLFALAALSLLIACLGWIWNNSVAELHGLAIDVHFLKGWLIALLGVAALLLTPIFGVAHAWRAMSDRLFVRSDRATRLNDHVLYTANDEANLLLRVAEFLPNLGAAVLRILANIALVAGMQGKFLLIAMPLLLASVPVQYVLGADPPETGLAGLAFDLPALLALSVTACLAVMVLFGALWLLLSAVLRFTPLSFGYEGLLSLLNMELRVARAPPAAESHGLSAWRATFERRSPFAIRHSAFYDDRRVIEMIGAIAAGREPIPSRELCPAAVAQRPPRPALKRLGAYTLPAYALGIILAELYVRYQPDISFDVEDGPMMACDGAGCVELENFNENFVDGCTVEADGSCTPPGETAPQNSPAEIKGGGDGAPPPPK